MKSKVCFRSFKVVSSWFNYGFRCIYFLVFETALYITFFVYTAYSSLRHASLLFNIVNVTSLRFNKLCLHPYHREHHDCSENFKARQEFSVLTCDRPVSNVPRSRGLNGAGRAGEGGEVKRGKLVRATLTSKYTITAQKTKRLSRWLTPKNTGIHQNLLYLV